MIRTTYSVLFVLAIASSCYGDLTIGFSTDSGSSFVNTETITAGDVLTVGVYLRDSDNNGILVNDGLLGFGIVGGLTPTNLGAIQNTMISSSFEFEPSDNSTSVFVDWKSATFNDPPSGTDVLLGTFEFATNGDGSSLFEFSDKNPGSGSGQVDWLSGAGAELDEQIFGVGATDSFQFTVNTIAVPEPSTSLVLLGIASLIGLKRRR